MLLPLSIAGGGLALAFNKHLKRTRARPNFAIRGAYISPTLTAHETQNDGGCRIPACAGDYCITCKCELVDAGDAFVVAGESGDWDIIPRTQRACENIFGKRSECQNPKVFITTPGSASGCEDAVYLIDKFGTRHEFTF